MQAVGPQGVIVQDVPKQRVPQNILRDGDAVLFPGKQDDRAAPAIELLQPVFPHGGIVCDHQSPSLQIHTKNQLKPYNPYKLVFQ